MEQPPQLPADECPFCFADREPKALFCGSCMFPLGGTKEEMQTFSRTHQFLKKMIDRSAWWINLAYQTLLGAALACVVYLPMQPMRISPISLLLFGLPGAFNLGLYFFGKRFTAVSAAVSGCVGILFLFALLMLGRGNVWLFAAGVFYTGCMGITFWQLQRTADLLRQHLVRGG